MCKTTSYVFNMKQGVFRNDNIRICSDVTARSCNGEIFFIKEVRFHPETDILVTLQINWRTVQNVKFSIIWRTYAVSELWKSKFSPREMYTLVQKVLLLALAQIAVSSF